MDTLNSLFPKSKAQRNRERYAEQASAAQTRSKARKVRERKDRRPEYGSAEWCETRGDDLGLSPDY